MRVHWIASVVSILVSMGVLFVIMGQYHVIDALNRTSDRLTVENERLSKQYPHETQLMELVDKEFTHKLTEVEVLEMTMVKIVTGTEAKKGEVETCEREMNTGKVAVEEEQKEQQETEANLKSESDVWNQEVSSLTAKLAEHSPVCAYLKPGAMIGNLCGSA